MVARPEIVAVPARLVLAVGVGLALAQRPRLTVGFDQESERALEGDEVDARIVLATETPVDRLEIYLRLPDGVDAARARNPTTIRLAGGERRELDLTLLAR